MARINIEEQAWKRAYRLAELMECTVREAIGTVACLWGNSQEIVKTHGSKSEILEWASLFKISDEEGEKWISALKNVRFISEEKNDLLKIHGNDIQLENRISNTSRAAKGGKALKKKLSDLKRLQAGFKHSSSKPQAGSKGLNALQGITEQGNAIQSNIISSSPQNAARSKSSKDTFSISLINEFKEKLPELSFKNWEQLYSPDYIERELYKALTWLSVNPQKNKKSIRGWVQFLSGWLERNWSKHQTAIPSQSQEWVGADLSRFEKKEGA